MKPLLLVSLLLLLCGCQTLSAPVKPQIPLGQGLVWSLPDLGWVKGERDKTQQVVAWHGKERWQLVGQLSLSPQKMTLTALSGFGTFLFQANFDGTVLTTKRSALVPAKANPGHLLADLSMALMPTAVLQQSLAPLGLVLSVKDHRRVISKQGKAIIVIEYQPMGFRFSQQQLGYGFEVTYE